MAVPDGFWDAGDEGTPDNMNQCLLQYDTAANLPAATANNKGMLYFETDTSLWKRSNGSTWDTLDPQPATQAAMEAETDEFTYVTPDRVINNPGVAKRWATFGTDAVLDNSFNATSVTDNGTGDFTVTWSGGASDAFTACANNGAGVAFTTGNGSNIQVFNDSGTKIDPAGTMSIIGFGDI